MQFGVSLCAAQTAHVVWLCRGLESLRTLQVQRLQSGAAAVLPGGLTMGGSAFTLHNAAHLC